MEADKITIEVGGRQLTLETGEIGRQANGSVLVTDGETVVYTTACCSSEATGDGWFMPLQVQYSERFSAAGKTSSGWLKRDGRPKDAETLTSRLVDRPLRPMFAPGWSNDTQVLIWVLSYDGEHTPEPLAITAAGAALALSDIPLQKAVAGVRMGLLDGQFVVNPTAAQMADSRLDLVMAGTADAVLMIEGYCNFLSEEEMLEAVRAGSAAVAVQCRAIDAWAARAGAQKRAVAATGPTAPAGLQERIASMATGEIEHAYCTITGKHARAASVIALQQRLKEQLGVSAVGAGRAAAPGSGPGPSGAAARAAPAAAQPNPPASEFEAQRAARGDTPVADDSGGEEDDAAPAGANPVRPSPYPGAADGAQAVDTVMFSKAFKRVEAGVMRQLVLRKGLRADGRGVGDVRPIAARAGLLPRTHGSALFTRGETQALAVTTLGSSRAAQRSEDMASEAEESRKFYLQYFFPPCSVGEVGRMGAPGRREIGHGALAERALAPIIPDEIDFPYTIRVESTITESNGSSSMATVCGACLAMQDAGVPVKRPVAGVAMGLMLEPGGGFAVLTDILGSEDALGDMDFKVAGDAEHITAFQMDIKVEGITLEVLAAALAQAGTARRHILAQMARCAPPPRNALAAGAPRIVRFAIDPTRIGAMIGAGGKNVRAVTATTGVESIMVLEQETGLIEVVGAESAGVEQARLLIQRLLEDAEEGNIYRDAKVMQVEKFGLIVEFLPGKEGLVHVSELDVSRTADPAKWAVGDSIDVMLTEKSDNGKFRLSRKAVLLLDSGVQVPQPGDVVRGAKVKEVLDMGVVIDLAPGVESFVHVSELEDRFVADTRELFSPGDAMDVLVLRPNDRGSPRCSRKAMLMRDARDKAPAAAPAPPPPPPPLPPIRERPRPKVGKM
ncbi:hypothetical protein WJX81_007489 [Elliptochloris bilobata]|uniref:polyribonucleotide nucleotidyltransferase n=1 Tax=Elliptochloris bilobata TaxID=381761 RepID=A0AAW1QJ46_9CHLO